MSVVPTVTATEEGRLNVEYGSSQHVCEDSAIQQGDITFLPIREVFSALGSIELIWAKDEAEDKIIIVTPNGKYQLVIDFENNKAIGIDQTYAIKNVNHTIYLPVKFYSDVFDCAIGWDNVTDTLMIGKTLAQAAAEEDGEAADKESPIKTVIPPKVNIVNLPAYVPTTVSRAQSTTTTYYQEGNASWYSDKFHGRRTSSGEAYDKNAYTAAHPTLPFGTIVRVTSKSNGKSVDVRINDRGPFVRGRVIDISRAAAAEIGLLSQGVGGVTLEIVQ